MNSSPRYKRPWLPFPFVCQKLAYDILPPSQLPHPALEFRTPHHSMVGHFCPMVKSRSLLNGAWAGAQPKGYSPQPRHTQRSVLIYDGLRRRPIKQGICVVPALDGPNQRCSLVCSCRGLTLANLPEVRDCFCRNSYDSLPYPTIALFVDHTGQRVECYIALSFKDANNGSAAYSPEVAIKG